MAVQNHTISMTSHAAENTAFTLVREKDRKEKQKDLAKLNAALVLLEEELVQAKSGKGKASVGASAGADAKESGKIVKLDQPKEAHESFQDKMAELALMLQLLQVKIAEAANNKANMDSEISKAQLTQAANTLKAIQEQIQQQQAAQDQQSVLDVILKVAQGALYAVSVIVAVCTLNPVTAGIIIGTSTALLVAGLSGGTKWVTDQIAQAIQNHPGLEEKDAKLLASGIVTALIVILSALAGSWGSALETTVEEGASAAVSGGEAALEESENAAASAAGNVVENAGEETVEQTTKSFFGRVSERLAKLSLRTKVAMMGFSQAASQTGLTSDIAVEIATSDKKKENQTEEEVIEVILSVLTALIGMAGTVGLMGGGNSVAEAGESGVEKMSTAARALAKAKNFINSSAGMNQVASMQTLMQLTSAGAAIAEGVIAAANELSLELPLIVRLEGTNVEMGRKLLKESGLTIISAEGMADAAKKAVEALQ